MGRVYLAHDRDLRRRVALKVVFLEEALEALLFGLAQGLAQA